MSAKDDLNIFFDNCAKEVSDRREYIRQYIELSDQCIKTITIKQPLQIDISEVVRHLAILSGYHREIVKGLRGNTPQSLYSKQFDSPMTSVFMCFYRFLFIKRLNHEQYDDIAIDIVYSTFLRFMRYIDIEVLNSGKQVTSLLNLVLQSNLINEYQHSKKRQKYYESTKVSYEDAICDMGYTQFGEDDDKFQKIDSKTKLAYLIEYIVKELPYEYELHNELTEMLTGRRKELSAYSFGLIDKWMKENNMGWITVMRNAITQHEEFSSDLNLGLTN